MAPPARVNLVVVVAADPDAAIALPEGGPRLEEAATRGDEAEGPGDVTGEEPSRRFALEAAVLAEKVGMAGRVPGGAALVVLKRGGGGAGDGPRSE
eukprot:CAMPEP_0196665816 /NCGR_PEP_ID=MMETSP1086-20130531/62675_1 /TAXON_ID=77921 /ORGANISM="Cyanoptyche  gloeocystis , Strain SAG4.97" /LENGTH=95 /DNA_ID=CAMNT_0042002765 /DNA_START=257 /DNA_END=544 /DNA_ORIENTATION=-